MQKQTWDLLPKQHDFLTCPAREVLYSGAFGAGKTRSVCMKAVVRAAANGAREALVRKHLVTLKATTLKTLLEPEGDLPAVLPPGTYTHNKSEKTIHIRGGGQIVYFGLDDTGKVGSYNLSGVGVDQAEELTEDDYTALRGRARLKLDGVANQLYSACNPAGPMHHLAVRFGLDGLHERAPGCTVIVTKSSDNYLLPASYLADLETYTGLARKRFVLGLWAGSEGLVYDTFDRQLFVKARPGPWSRVIVGVDWGYTNPSAIVAVCQDESGALHVSDEFYRTGQLEPDIVRQCELFRRHHGAETFVVDPSAAALRETMARANLNVIAGNNDVFGGISRVQKRMVADGDGKPRLTIDPGCVNLLNELGVYEWMPGKDKPRKEHDHLCDALRYSVMHLDEGGDLEVRLLGDGDAGARRRANPSSEAGWQTVWRDPRGEWR